MSYPLVITKSSIESDSALMEGGRGARKIIVTEIYEGKEVEYSDSTWRGLTKRSPVMELQGGEMAIFNETTPQDRHFHKEGTEIYTVLEGAVTIEVNNILYGAKSGETIIVAPNQTHEVYCNSRFLVQVITLNCGGIKDKYVV